MKVWFAPSNLRSFTPCLSFNTTLQLLSRPRNKVLQQRPLLYLPLTQSLSLTTTTSHNPMMPPPQRKQQGARRGGGGGHRPYHRKPDAANRTETVPNGGGTPPAPSLAEADATELPAALRAGSTAVGTRPFSDMKDVLDKSLLQAVENMGFKFMSPVQQKVLTELPSLSADCLVQAKTGTGKTAAFLLPAIQNLLQGNQPPRGHVGILVICPTRELALQIAKECDQITACLPRKMECHSAFGGTARASNLNKFLRGDPTILVATPGRLDDILGEETVREKFQHVKTVVLDEADRMLDQGFAPAIHKILRSIPHKREGWQGMCFSATLPEKVNDVVKCVLKPGYTSLSTINKEEAPTVDRIPQFFITVPSIDKIFAALYALIEAEYKDDPQNFKAIVFGTTANGVALFYDWSQTLFPGLAKFELHSRMNQNSRTRTTQQYKDATSGILFASDVVGRGMDFPNVGLVIQVGLPSSADQYVHRVGRTARAGKDGRAVMILFQNEAFFVSVNRSLPMKPYPVDIASSTDQYQPIIEKAFARVDEESKAKAYQAFLGYNKTYLSKLRLQPAGLVQLANEYSRTMGCPEPPLIEKKTVGKMGLKGVPGLNIGTRR